MQSVPGFPTDLTSAEPTATVRIGGIPVEFDSVSLESALESAMPSQVAVAGGAVVAATGSVSLLSGDAVTSSPGNPWGSGVPPQGTSVSVSAGYEGAEAQLFTGVSDGTSGAPSDPIVSAGLIDGVDRLDRPITIPPMLSTWPNLTDGSYVWRRVGLSPLWVTNEVLRHCGFYATPFHSGSVIFSAQMMGSAWPAVGSVTTAAAASNPDAAAAWRMTPWGIALANGVAQYVPDLGSASGKVEGTFQTVFNLNYRPAATASLTWTLMWGEDRDHLRVVVNSAGDIVAQVRGTGGYVQVVRMYRTQYMNSETFAIRWLTSGNVTIYASNGANATGTGTIPTGALNAPMTRIDVDVPQTSHNIGGLQITYSTNPFQNFKRSATLTPPASEFGEFSIPSITAWPGAVSRNCAELLKEQAEAELAAMWIDEEGRFRWVNRNILANTAPVGSLTSMDSLLDLPWEIPAKSIYSGVEIEGKSPTISRRGWPTINLFQGTGTNLDNGDEDNQFIESPAEETWFMVEPPTRIANANLNDVRQGRKTYIGGVVTTEGGADRIASWEELPQAWSQLEPQKWLLKSTAHVASAQQVETRFTENSSYGKYSGTGLPVVRGKAIARWSDVTYKGAAIGPPNAALLTHDVGYWIQDPVEVQGIADWLASRVTVSQPIIRDVPIVPDPRIQKGDVFWLEDSHSYGVRLKVLVMGISLTVSAGPPVAMDQSITCRVIEARRPWVTLDEHDAVWSGNTLNQHDSFWSGKTLNQHDADPLAH